MTALAAPTPPSVPTDLPDQRRAVAALVALAVSAFAMVTTELLPGGVLTFVAADLGRSTAQIGLLVTAYAAVVVIASVPLTRLTASWPRRPLLAGTVLLAAAGLAGSAVAPTYEMLFVARVATALAQAVFWVMVVPVAASMFREEIRGKMVTRVTMGGSLVGIIGLPAAAWIASAWTWRAAFGALSAMCLVAGVAVAVLLPSTQVAAAGSEHGARPDKKRFALLIVAGPLLSASVLGLLTYQTKLFIDVADIPADVLGPVLLAGGVCGLLATYVAGLFADRRPWGMLMVACGILLVAFALWALSGAGAAFAIVGSALTGFGFSLVPGTYSHLTMVVAPGRTDTATAWASMAFNVGTGTGAAIGAAAVSLLGVRTLPLVMGVGLLAALVVLRVATVGTEVDGAPAARERPVSSPQGDV